MPVPIAPVDRQARFRSAPARAERRDQFANLAVDRAGPAEVVVMFRDREQSFPGTFRPRVTFSRNGITSSGFSGPPNPTTRIESYDAEEF